MQKNEGKKREKRISESPLITFSRKLNRHNALREGNKLNLIFLIYFKLLISEPFRLFENKKFIKEVEKIDPVKSPVFIIGHWRSGTTYTHFLLSKDPYFFYQNKYKNFFSDNFLTTEDFFKPVLSRFIEFFSPVKKWENNINKTMDLDSPSESDTALISEISEFTYHWAHLFPRSYKEYFNKFLFLEDISQKELDQWKNTMKILLNKVYYKHNEGKLLVKNPGDTARIRHLLEIYPGAKFIFIHRNPYDVFYSNIKLWDKVLNTVSFQTLSKKEEKDLILNVYKKLHKKYEEQKMLLSEDQIIEVGYNDITERPLDVLKQIYYKLNIPGFNEAYINFSDYLKDNPVYKNNSYKLDYDNVKLINYHWKEYFDRWGYEMVDPEKLRDLS